MGEMSTTCVSERSPVMMSDLDRIFFVEVSKVAREDCRPPCVFMKGLWIWWATWTAYPLGKFPGRLEEVVYYVCIHIEGRWTHLTTWTIDPSWKLLGRFVEMSTTYTSERSLKMVSDFDRIVS